MWQLGTALIVVALLASCSSSSVPAISSPVPGSSNAAVGASSYPAPAKGGYPAPTTNAPYPNPAERDATPTACAGPAFTLNPPKTSDTVVTGTGPANVSIRVVDVTRAGAVVGNAAIDAGGKFSATVTDKLIENDSLGLMLGPGEDRKKFACGPGYQDIPTVGIVVAKTRVTK
ncbi:MAG: hypothetical protein NVS2B7_24430 [Herpetosiphon sp.]